MSDDHGHGGGHDDHGGGDHGGGHKEPHAKPLKFDNPFTGVGPFISFVIMAVATVTIFLFMWLLVKPVKWMLYFLVVVVLWRGLKQLYHLMWDPLPPRVRR